VKQPDGSPEPKIPCFDSRFLFPLVESTYD
jgi:hypothetical protein